MTGYGQASTEHGDARFTVELRSLNHRFADLRLRLPPELADAEREVRRKVLERVRRGRVELTVNVEPIDGGTSRPRLNQPLLEEILSACKTMNDDYRIEGQPDVRAILAVSGIFRATAVEVEWDDEERDAFARSLGSALDALDAERLREGSHLQQDLSKRFVAMSEIVEQIRERAESLPDRLRQRLVERLGNLGGEVALEPARVAQEAVLLAERSDVTEELVRLVGHIEQASGLIDRPDGKPVGKRLDFLLQEIQRETNTVNSKSADLELSRMTLELKSGVEKVREQVQNLE